MSEYPKCPKASAPLKMKAICSQNHIVKCKHHNWFSTSFLSHSVMEAVIEISPKSE